MLIRHRIDAVDAGADSRSRLRSADWVGVAAALALALGVTAILLSTAKAPLILYDGDSQLPMLWRASVWAGQPQEWVLSSPLFLIELLLYGPAALLPLPNPVTLALFSVIGWFVLYLSARALTAAAGLRARAGVIAALAIVAVPAVEASLEQSPDRNALEPAALLSTTTYYSGSFIASVLLLALVARSVRSAHEPKPLVLAATAALSFVASMSNPLFIAWTVGPLVLVVLILGLAGVGRPAMFITGIAMATGAGAGLLARLPFSPILVQDNLAKVRLDLASQSAQYYLALADQRLHDPGGPLEVPIILAMFAFAIVTLIVAVRRRHATAIAVGAFAVASPAITAVASVVVGTFAARYLQPIAFFPPLAITSAFALVLLRPRRSAIRVWSPGRMRAVGIAGLLLSLVVGATGTVFLARTTTTPDASVACAVQWIDHRGVPGAGQYWSVRAVKAAISDPRDLVQTDQYLQGYSWLTDNADFHTKQVYFTITDNESVAFDVGRQPATVIRCGRYTIDDYGSQPLDVGAPHH